MKQSIIILLFLFSSVLHAQEDSSRYFTIGLVPTYLFDPITPSVGIVLEHSLGKNITCEILYGMDSNWAPIYWHPDRSSWHHDYKLTLKYIFGEENLLNLFPYIGLDYFGNVSKYQRENDIYQEEGTYFSYDQAEILRLVNGARVNCGMKMYAEKRIVVDAFIGLGGRQVDIEYRPENSRVTSFDSFDEWIGPFDRQAGKRWTIAIIFGVKIAYRVY